MRIKCLNLTDQTLSLDVGHITYTLYPKGANFPQEGKVDFCFIQEDDTQHPVVQTFLYGQGGPKIRLVTEELVSPMTAGDFVRMSELNSILSGYRQALAEENRNIDLAMQARLSGITKALQDENIALKKQIDELNKTVDEFRKKFDTISKEDSKRLGGKNGSKPQSKVETLFNE